MNRRQLLKFLSLGLLPVGSSSVWACLRSEGSIDPAISQKESIVFESEADSGTQITLFACGSAGIALCRDLDKRQFGLRQIVAIDSSKRTLESFQNADDRLLLLTENGKKPRTPLAVDRTIQKHLSQIEKSIQSSHAVIIVGGLGGDAGTSITATVAEVARDQGTLIFSLVGLPFSFESHRRQLLAKQGFSRLRTLANNLVLIEDSERSSPVDDLLLSQVLKDRRAAVQNYLWNTCGCIQNLGLVGIDFEDIRTVFDQSNSGRISRIGWAQASGQFRASMAADQALNHRYLKPLSTQSAQSVGVSIRSSRALLKMKEVKLVMDTVNAHIGAQADVIFSADYDDSLNDQLQVSFVLS